ncbi:MAG: hypothetical protein COV74_01865 [Candidatus Omnitrophica bacterium CG11_big_fil_rev_8_21_14_0_20_45_26]|uniref:DUF177 domain-containing protein n=1 Tax=Candidatus Abzuiibacterium crystallinum TaxID=1974748 RepID=A0A2H0LUE3_9BACT|nr:MAG: hypothetical protein COV74_01865 [Candidatus Omnitrophica bacterium CG11_big_fil_rev_8_21_14_0_20_45_26]PIW65043.1 MAG: hypothetical protein COW12_04145 [Candidatus Omnitrophica bacterium CG12_big_fil_rev_8_21_14_0_65_45_16]
MIIQVLQLKDSTPTPIEEILPAGTLDIDAVDMHYVGEVTVRGNAEKNLNTLVFRGHIYCTREQTCARCLKKVVNNIDESVDYAYDIKGLKEIDLSDDIRDSLILDQPERFLCDSECKGLCPHCGIDLNTSKCHCRETRKADSFKNLKKWFSNT